MVAEPAGPPANNHPVEPGPSRPSALTLNADRNQPVYWGWESLPPYHSRQSTEEPVGASHQNGSAERHCEALRVAYEAARGIAATLDGDPAAQEAAGVAVREARIALHRARQRAGFQAGPAGWPETAPSSPQ